MNECHNAAHNHYLLQILTPWLGLFFHFYLLSLWRDRALKAEARVAELEEENAVTNFVTPDQ